MIPQNLTRGLTDGCFKQNKTTCHQLLKAMRKVICTYLQTPLFCLSPIHINKELYCKITWTCVVSPGCTTSNHLPERWDCNRLHQQMVGKNMNNNIFISVCFQFKIVAGMVNFKKRDALTTWCKPLLVLALTLFSYFVRINIDSYM